MSNHTFASFGAHLAMLAVEIVVSERRALEAAAKVVEKEAKSEFGVYQDGIGPYPAWANLAESTVEDRIRQGFTPDDPLLRTGALRDSISHQVEGLAAEIGSPEQVMVYMENGTSKAPPRPVLGPALMRNEKVVMEILAGYTVAALLKGSTFVTAPKILKG